ncbi:contact-dependent growth inhibition system immunity protein [Asanoa iriomotensis]|nr:contact-dependent growth inhibition system immunity protein [Asanoa iriomotensis]
MARPPRRPPPGVPHPTTVEEFERVRQADPGPDASYLVRRCTELGRKPVDQFTTEDLRVMLGQRIGVPILLPIAVAVLLDDPLAEGDYFPGDLLHNVLRLDAEDWRGAERHRDRLADVVRTMPLSDDANADLRRAAARFVRGLPARPVS